ncbi:alpha-N-acetylgalactosaminidase-like isoform X2 [Littorina saxatilis]|uniref:Alpha-galactosidase n=1 Tax=Littorina saxatilis TaxID=31220 RepID=A0AAN9G6G0_9CAEN
MDRRLMKWAMVSLTLVQTIQALDNGLARTPPMGWLDWERFRCNVDCVNDPDNCISEKLFMQMADIIVAEGYKDVGYEYVCIDDCWLAESRDEHGRLMADPERFPSGIKALADYMHTRGLKLGIYEDFGQTTCDKYPGSEFFLQQDAQTFADWGVDLLKLDACNLNAADNDYGFPIMSFYLNQTGRPILFSCDWAVYQYYDNMSIDYAAVAKYCNIWRNYHDMQDSWDSVMNTVEYFGTNQGGFQQHVGPGSFSDPDMLIVGDFGLSYDQQRVHMGMWAMLAAPLIMSNDLRHIDPKSKALLQNRRVLAINQDPLGHPATRVTPQGFNSQTLSLWTKPLIKPQGSFAVAIVNKDIQGTPTRFSIRLADLNLSNNSGYNLTEVFDGLAMGVYSISKPINISVNPTGIVLFQAVPV